MERGIQSMDGSTGGIQVVRKTGIDLQSSDRSRGAQQGKIHGRGPGDQGNMHDLQSWDRSRERVQGVRRQA